MFLRLNGFSISDLGWPRSTRYWSERVVIRPCMRSWTSVERGNTHNRVYPCRTFLQVVSTLLQIGKWSWRNAVVAIILKFQVADLWDTVSWSIRPFEFRWCRGKWPCMINERFSPCGTDPISPVCMLLEHSRTISKQLESWIPQWPLRASKIDIGVAAA